MRSNKNLRQFQYKIKIISKDLLLQGNFLGIKLYFLDIVIPVTILDTVVDCKAYERNAQVNDRSVCMALYNVECYNCHNYGHMTRYCRSTMNHNVECYKWKNYGHIDHDCRSMINNSKKENIDIKYKTNWKKNP